MRTTFLPYCRPTLDDDEIASVVATLRAGWLTSGPAVAEFEQAFARAAEVPHAIALNSCTAALHVALRAMGVGPGDDVVMPSLTFVAGAQCVLELGARPVFADIDPRTFSVSARTIEAALTERTRVVIAMPYAGRPLDIDAVVSLAHARGIRVLEDAAHAVGTLDRGRWAGARADAAAYSFYATKNLSTGEGGMLVTHDAVLAERARVLALHGMDRDAWKRYSATGSWRYDVREPGFKYNLADPLAALGLAGLERLDARQTRRAEIACIYTERIAALPGLQAQAEVDRDDDRMSWCMYALLVDPVRAGITRDTLVERLRDERIGASVHYIPTHRFSGYRALASTPLPMTEFVADRILSLPLYPGMSDDDVESVLDALERSVTPRAFALGGR